MRAHTQRTVDNDGARLAVFEYGQPAAPETPTVVLVHGYPDDHTIFRSVIEDLSADHRVIAYDTRNAGTSRVGSGPRVDDRSKDAGAGPAGNGTAGTGPLAPYRLPLLVADLYAVLAEVAGQPVHLVGHDWGSIQGWAAVRDARSGGRILSFTSISGPDIGHLRRWFARCLRSPRRWFLGAGQAVRSTYVAFFQLPVLPELFCRLLGPRYARRAGTDAAAATDNAVRGLQLYRANLLGSGVSGTGPLRPVEVPVHVLVPLLDPFLSPRLTDGLGEEVPELRISPVDGGHWWHTEDSAAFCRMLRQFEISARP